MQNVPIDRLGIDHRKLTFKFQNLSARHITIPTHSSWLNQEERFFGKITADMIRRGVFHSVPQLKRAIMTYIKENNKDPKLFQWRATAD